MGRAACAGSDRTRPDAKGIGDPDGSGSKHPRTMGARRTGAGRGVRGKSIKAFAPSGRLFARRVSNGLGSLKPTLATLIPFAKREELLVGQGQDSSLQMSATGVYPSTCSRADRQDSSNAVSFQLVFVNRTFEKQRPPRGNLLVFALTNSSTAD